MSFVKVEDTANVACVINLEKIACLRKGDGHWEVSLVSGERILLDDINSRKIQDQLDMLPKPKGKVTVGR